MASSLRIRNVLIGLFAGCLLSGAASADELSRVVRGEMPTVRDRFDGMGMRAGSFWILPTVQTGVFYEGNVFGSSSGQQDSGGWFISPNVAVKSDFGRHELNINLGANNYTYFDTSSQDRTDFNGSVDGRIDVRHDLVILGGIRGGLFQQLPGDLEYGGIVNGTLQSVEPGNVYNMEAWGTINKEFNRVGVSIGGAFGLADYDDINGIDQEYRNQYRYTVGGRLSYLYMPGYRGFADFRYNWVEHPNSNIAMPADSLSDSQGWRALGGVEFEITHLVSGEVGMGYMEQDYDDPSQSDSGAFSYSADLVWNPTMLMTVTLSADRTFEDSTFTQAGRLQDAFKLTVDYEVLRTLVMSPMVGFSYNDYDNSSLTDWRYVAGLQVDYSMNRFLSLGARYGYEYADYGSQGFSDWDRHAVGIYATARF